LFLNKQQQRGELDIKKIQYQPGGFKCSPITGRSFGEGKASYFLPAKGFGRREGKGLSNCKPKAVKAPDF
jgi:hypothetical protein